MVVTAGIIIGTGEAEDPVHSLVVAVVAQFMPDMEQDKPAAGQPNGQPGDVDQREHPSLTNVAEDGGEVVVDHGSQVRMLILFISDARASIYP